jgi:alpha-tubulin suppressor-like RCC1 family protein
MDARMRTLSETSPSNELLSDARRRGFVAVLLVSFCVLALSASASAASTGVLAWGENVRGELGDAGTERSDVPMAVGGLSGVTAVSAGADFSLALLSDGTVTAWGENGFGQLGNATAGVDSLIAVPVNGLGEVTQVAAGGNHALALLRNGTVMAWGYNAFGQLGDGKTGYENSSDVPVPVSGLSEVTAVAAGYNDSFALLRNGTVEAWGYNASGELGTGSTAEANPTPAPVSGLSQVTAISAGLGGVATALLSDGTVMDWGYGQFGELGDGTNESSDVPVAVSGLSGVVALPDGGETMALLSNGTVMDWGLGSSGMLGNGTGGGSSDVPVAVSGLTGVTAIAGGFEHRLALLSNGKVMAWGNGADGMLGLGSEAGSEIPVEVSGLGEATSIATGQYFSLAVGTFVPVSTPPVTEGTEPKSPEETPAEPKTPEEPKTPKTPEETETPEPVIEAPAPETPEPALGPVSETGAPPVSPLATVDPSSSTVKNKALRLCARKPRKQRATCERQTEKKYATTAKKSNKK